ncbi:MAG: GNAT family N-acetyltransferase [Alphaproteobacteria bacterium]|nr:GNAT family N-acetyltransferase [Alphaproteobacteria bacterium]
MSECKVYVDPDGSIMRWVCRNLGEDSTWVGEHLTFGFAVDNRMVGGLIFNQYRPHHDVWWTIFSNDKRWCTRAVLRQMFTEAFVRLDCRRINLLISKSNKHAVKFVRRLGFKKEGTWRQFRENGEDCYVFGMLKSECQWIMKG